MKLRMTLLAASALVAGCLSSAAFAQTGNTNVDGHPRINEIDQRLDNQQNRIDNGVKDGQVNAKEEMRDDNRDQRVEKQLSKDEAEHNGHITKGEQERMNKELNKNSKDIHRQRKNGEERKEHRREERKEHREHRDHDHDGHEHTEGNTAQ